MPPFPYIFLNGGRAPLLLFPYKVWGLFIFSLSVTTMTTVTAVGVFVLARHTADCRSVFWNMWCGNNDAAMRRLAWETRRLGLYT